MRKVAYSVSVLLWTFSSPTFSETTRKLAADLTVACPRAAGETRRLDSPLEKEAYKRRWHWPRGDERILATFDKVFRIFEERSIHESSAIASSRELIVRNPTIDIATGYQTPAPIRRQRQPDQYRSQQWRR